ncbi:hypothetical protein Tco_1093047 [Tanacetum coccineum]|uniref:Uncharacterized protein n=1 Tax=Tanacetum coccineum TaxID=301880 RepID=A0ABQ5ICY8_9ASTR
MCVCACVCENERINGERDQRKRIIQFLIGLDERSENVKGQILLMNPMPTVAKAHSLIRQEDKEKEGFSFKNTPTALSAHSNNPRNSYNNNLRFDNSRSGRSYYSQGESSRSQNATETTAKKKQFQERCNMWKLQQRRSHQRGMLQDSWLYSGASSTWEVQTY